MDILPCVILTNTLCTIIYPIRKKPPISTAAPKEIFLSVLPAAALLPIYTALSLYGLLQHLNHLY